MLKTIITVAGVAGTLGAATPAFADWYQPVPAPVYTAPPVYAAPPQPVYGYGYGYGYRNDGWREREAWRRREMWERQRHERYEWRHHHHGWGW